MHKLTTALGLPQHRFASIHVVGTNGKSSVTRMTAALLEAHGLRSGAVVSPHTDRWAQRTLIAGEEVDEAAWTAAVDQVARAAEGVNRSLEEGEAVTQFEAATAASFVALAAARVEVAVVEAGLGGRLDATNTIPSRLTVLTSIGLDHTEWLGETEVEIAAEKLAVLRDQTTLVLGEVSAEVAELAEQTARERGARLVRAAVDLDPGVHLRAAGEFQRRNFAHRLRSRRGVPRAAARLRSGHRRCRRGHSPGPARADRRAPRSLYRRRPQPRRRRGAGRARCRRSRTAGAWSLCLAVLADKDAAAMIAALAPVLDRAVCTELPANALEGHGRPGARSRPAAELAAACEAIGLQAEAEPDFAAALKRGRALAAEPPAGALLVAGSHYAIGPARAVLAT